MTMKIDAFTNQYKLQKTLRFKLIPQGKTEDYFEERHILATDEKRAAEYGEVKQIIDRYHIDFIDRVLENLSRLEGQARIMV